MNGVKPCPFCGSEAEFDRTIIYGCEIISCKECDCLLIVEGLTEQEAIEAWNTRAERTCKPTAKPNVWGFCNYYCKCGNKLLEVANGIGECLPNYCKNCGAKIIE